MFTPHKALQAADVPGGFPHAELVALPALVGDHGAHGEQIPSQPGFHSIPHIGGVIAAAWGGDTSLGTVVHHRKGGIWEKPWALIVHSERH